MFTLFYVPHVCVAHTRSHFASPATSLSPLSVGPSVHRSSSITFAHCFRHEDHHGPGPRLVGAPQVALVEGRAAESQRWGQATASHVALPASREAERETKGQRSGQASSHQGEGEERVAEDLGQHAPHSICSIVPSVGIEIAVIAGRRLRGIARYSGAAIDAPEQRFHVESGCPKMVLLVGGFFNLMLGLLYLLSSVDSKSQHSLWLWCTVFRQGSKTDIEDLMKRRAGGHREDVWNENWWRGEEIWGLCRPSIIYIYIDYMYILW